MRLANGANFAITYIFCASAIRLLRTPSLIPAMEGHFLPVSALRTQEHYFQEPPLSSNAGFLEDIETFTIGATLRNGHNLGYG